MRSIEAGYLGGHPAAKKPIEYGWLEIDGEGNVTYSAVKMVNMLERKVPEFTISGATVASADLDVATTLKRGGGAREIALAGGTGAALHKRRVGSKNTPLDVHVATSNQDYVVQFACEAHDGAAWLQAAGLAEERGSSGPAVSPETPRESAGDGPAFIADELLKLAQLRDADILTDAEFTAQKGRLLGAGG